MNPNRNTGISILITILTLTVVAAVSIYILTNRKNSDAADTLSYELALLSDESGTANQTIIKQCSKALEDSSNSLDKSYKTYPVNAQDTSSYETAIQKAATNKAKLIICPDSSFMDTVYKIQNNYLHTYFLLVNTSYHNTSLSDNSIPYNMIPIQFDESEMGFLAGYALVYEGNTKLTFIGSFEDACSTHYEYGLLQGADAAATDLDIQKVTITCKHAKDIEEVKTISNNHYKKSDILISTCDDYTKTIYDIAKEQNSKLVACSNYYTDFEKEGPLVGVAAKNVDVAVSRIIDDFYSSIINGGKTNLFNAANKGISFKFDETYFNKFNSQVYQKILDRLAKNEIQIISDTTVTPEELGLKRIILQ